MKIMVLWKVVSAASVSAISMASFVVWADVPAVKSETVVVATPNVTSKPIAVVPSVAAKPSVTLMSTPQLTQEIIPKSRVTMGTQIPECHVVAGYGKYGDQAFYTNTTGKPIATVDPATGKTVWTDKAPIVPVVSLVPPLAPKKP